MFMVHRENTEDKMPVKIARVDKLLLSFEAGWIKCWQEPNKLYQAKPYIMWWLQCSVNMKTTMQVKPLLLDLHKYTVMSVIIATGLCIFSKSIQKYENIPFNEISTLNN